MPCVGCSTREKSDLKNTPETTATAGSELSRSRLRRYRVNTASIPRRYISPIPPSNRRTSKRRGAPIAAFGKRRRQSATPLQEHIAQRMMLEIGDIVPEALHRRGRLGYAPSLHGREDHGLVRSCPA